MRKPNPRPRGKETRPKQTNRTTKIRKARGEDLRMDGRGHWGPSIRRCTFVLMDMVGPMNVTLHMYSALSNHIKPGSNPNNARLYRLRYVYRNQMDDYGNIKYAEGDRKWVLAFLKAYDYRIRARKPMRIRPINKVKKKSLFLNLRLDKVKKP